MSSFIKSNQVWIISAGAIGLAVAYYLYNRNKKCGLSRKIPDEWTTAGKVLNIHLYPLKSGRKIDLTRAECTNVGIQEPSRKGLQLRDRSFIVYKEQDREFRTARTHPTMVLIDIDVHDDSHVAFDAPGMRTLYVEIPTENTDNVLKITKQQGEQIHSLDCGDEAAKWFSRYMNNEDSGLRLAYNNNKKPRDITKTHAKFIQVFQELNNKATGLYSDLTSVMLCNQLSVDDLNKKIPGTKVITENFRPNIIVSASKPYEEDTWKWLKIGDCIFKNVKPCTRCILTTVNPTNGVKSSDGEPLTTLKKYRLLDDPKERELYPSTPIMGINLEVVKMGKFKVNDDVLVA